MFASLAFQSALYEITVSKLVSKLCRVSALMTVVDDEMHRGSSLLAEQT